MAEKEREEEIDWENPFDDVRFSEITDIKLQFLDNGVKIRKKDDKGVEYTQYKFLCIRLDMKNPKEVSCTTSSKRLIEELKDHQPLKNRKLQITTSGAGFQKLYKARKIEK